MEFPHTVRIERVATIHDAARGNVEIVSTLASSAAVLITQASGSRPDRNAQEPFVTDMTISGEAMELAMANVRCVVLSGPFAGETVHLHEWQVCGPVGGIPRFYRRRGSIVGG